MAVARPATDVVAVLDNMMVLVLFLGRASGVMGQPLRVPMCRSTASFLAGAVSWLVRAANRERPFREALDRGRRCGPVMHP
jgi:hypothetical protein